MILCFGADIAAVGVSFASSRHPRAYVLFAGMPILGSRDGLATEEEVTRSEYE